MDQQIAVRIRNLTKVIRKKVIVDGLSLEIPSGEVFGLLGPNGAGKTTTIRMMVGLIAKSQGEVWIKGINVDKDFTRAMNHVGAIVENPELYSFLTGYQNLKHFANMSVGVTDEQIDSVIKRVGLEARIHHKVRTYSLGMRQRLGLAQALLRNPDVLILDEPTNGLDPAGIRELRDHLRSLAKDEGITVIVSSHLLSEMELMCDRVAVIQAGKLIDVKTIRELVDGEEAHKSTEIEVDSVTAAARALQSVAPDLQVVQQQDKIVITAMRSDIPEVIRQLVMAGVKVYGVRVVNQSLEDRFLAMTGGDSHVI